MSAQVITCAIQVPSIGEQFVCSAVYAYNTAVDRIRLWEELRGAKAAYDHLNLPWILIGDFNELWPLPSTLSPWIIAEICLA